MNGLLIAAGCLCLTPTGPSALSPTPYACQDEQREALLTNADVIELNRLGFDDSAVIERIRRAGHRFDISPEGIRQLEAAGVSGVIIKVMIDSEEETVVNSGAASADKRSARPKVTTGGARPSAPELTPAQIDAQERATTRANRPVPVAPGEAGETAAPPVDPPSEPAPEPPATVSRRAASTHAPSRSLKKRRKPHRH